MPIYRGSLLRNISRIARLQRPHFLGDQLSINLQWRDRQQKIYNPARLVLQHIPPGMHRRSIDGAIARFHHAFLPAIELELELALDDAAVPEREGTMRVRGYAGGEIDDADQRAVVFH